MEHSCTEAKCAEQAIPERCPLYDLQQQRDDGKTPIIDDQSTEEIGQRRTRMLVLTRKVGEQIRIGTDIVVTVTAVDYNRVRIGIEAPREILILREEKVGIPKEGAPHVRTTELDRDHSSAGDTL